MDGIRRSDSFTVFSKSHLCATDVQIISLLYQPIIGTGAFALYFTLLGLVDHQTLVSSDYLQGDLESLLDTRLDIIENDRFRLEAIGLMETYYSDDHFMYEIKPPLSAESFINDGILGQYLIASITKDRFKKILNSFKLKPPALKKYTRMTKAFDEVFRPIGVTESLPESDLLGNNKGKSIHTNHTTFDWRFFIESLTDDTDWENKIQNQIKEKILNLHYVYGLDELTMRSVLLKSIDENEQINVNKMAVNAREEYKQMASSIPEGAKEIEKPEERNLPSDPVEYFTVVSPRQLLAEMSGGKFSAADLRIVERILEETGIDRGVLNVLLAYVAKIKDGSLPGYEYFEKVALDWKKNQVTDVKTAIAYVQHISSRYQQAKESIGNRKQRTKPADDIKIDWLDEYIQSIK
ncbi:MAG TPA: DnaD domain protein [Bacillota bacterium]|nr:DnaD domain protein [Bacillota bacterium]